jgi:nicotinamidase-related amidase
MNPSSALIVIDAQKGFRDAVWGPGNNPGADGRIATLLLAWREAGLPVVLVRHNSLNPASVLHPSSPGNQFLDGVDGVHDLLVEKSVNSAFYGEPNLDEWLKERGIAQLVLCGITTNHCCETTPRMAGNLGYEVSFVVDATRTFDRTGPDGVTLSADELTRATVASLHEEFATIVTTDEVLSTMSTV